ncbi:MAG: glycosyltransferase family 4 protein [Atribacterota bacterium]
MNNYEHICLIHASGYNALINKCIGGTGIQLKNIAKELTEYSYKVTFLSWGESQPSKKLTIDGIEIIKGPSIKSRANIIRKIKEFILFFRKFREINADIYFTSSATSMVFLVSIFCRLYGKKHLHRTTHVRECNNDLIRENIFYGMLHKIGIKLTDVVFVQTQSHKQMLKENYGKESLVLRNSFKIKELNPKKKNFVLWVARRVKWKRPELFIKLADKFPSKKFIMISPQTGSNPKYSKKIKNLSEQVNNLELINRVDSDKIQEYYNKAKLFIGTSLYEGFPNTYLQACQGKTPIVSLIVDPDKFITKYNCGFVCNDDFKTLTEKVAFLLGHSQKRKELGEKAFSYYKNNHNIDENIKLVLKAIENLNESNS